MTVLVIVVEVSNFVQQFLGKAASSFSCRLAFIGLPTIHTFRQLSSELRVGLSIIITSGKEKGSFFSVSVLITSHFEGIAAYSLGKPLSLPVLHFWVAFFYPYMTWMTEK
jgi:hypothetical protein